MNCPNCGKDMSGGFLQTGSLVAFNKTRHRISLNPRDPEDVMVFKSMVAAGNFNGSICKECGLIVFDYENPVARR